ncbi:NmrA family NAD(P)-binding protein [Pedobacter boryungensis]|uniref:NAD(P)H-binding protein n=1 Tax=Pedobacter boryungensis TaxID=869962 RepID=A0ABX2DE48_9SPHI|nr:NAD(P)H-binding protein [Pedobacter boryungensis]NQX32275.1 NAD(P)H-binding protein [Pedobacter boryungensis]
MKVVLTGSLGHISKPLAIQLIAKGHSVTIISSKTDKQEEIEKMGAKPAIGTIEDLEFLSNTFKGADIVYLMEPPFNFFDPTIDITGYWLDIAKNYAQAIQQSGVTKVIHLSSIGGHTDQGVGLLATHHWVENILKELPSTVSIKTMRPVGFYYNMFAFIPSIKNAGSIFQNYGGDEFKEPWVSPLDIADTIAEEIDLPFDGREIRYIASDEVTPNEVAAILGEAIGKSDVKWVVISNEDFIANLQRVGFSSQGAEGLAAMNQGRMSGVLYDDYNKNKPTLGKVKLTDFAKDFAMVFNQGAH